MTFDEAVSRLGRVQRAMNKGSPKAMEQTLRPGEDVLALDFGNGERDEKPEPGVLAVTDSRVIWASKTLGTGGVRDFRYDRIATVDVTRPSLLSKGHTFKLETSGGDLTVNLLSEDYGSLIRDHT
jgi:hypothetical protein